MRYCKILNLLKEEFNQCSKHLQALSQLQVGVPSDKLAVRVK